MEKVAIIVAGIALVLHGLMELAPLLMRGNRNVQEGKGMPKFIFTPLQENLRVTTLLGEIFGAIRIIAAIGLFLNLMWGWALGVVISVVTYVVMTVYLPMGIVDGIISTITLVGLLVAFFGSQPIIH